MAVLVVLVVVVVVVAAAAAAAANSNFSIVARVELCVGVDETSEAKF